MRREGEKLSPEAVRRATPRRAELVVTSTGSELHARLMFPWLGPTSPGDNLPALKDCRLRAIQRGQLVLHGGEFVGMHHQRRLVPQAWWCTVLPESERPAMRREPLQR